MALRLGLPRSIAVLICLLAPLGASADLIRYAWTGFLEPGNAPGNPWGLSGDGSTVTQNDGTPFSLEVTVDTNAQDQDTDEPHFAQFIPTSATILIDGTPAQNGNDLELIFIDNHDTFDFDDVELQGHITFMSTSLFFGAEVRLPTDTFSQGPGFVDLPPLFDPKTPVQLGGFGGDVLTYPADAPVTATSIPNIPEPSTAALVGVGLWVLGNRRRGASGRA